MSTANNAVLTTTSIGVPFFTELSLNGEVLIGSSGGIPRASTITAGTGISILNEANSITITNSAGGFTWNEVTGTSDTLAVQNGYIANNAGLVTLTLPATGSLGDTIQVVGKGSGLFKIAKNAGQTINFSSSSTTTGASGSITSIEQFAGLELICTTANTGWTAVDSIGNFTIV